MPIPKEAGTLGMPSKASKAVVGGHGTGRGACGHRHGNGRRRRDAFGAIWPCFGRELDPTSPNQGQKASPPRETLSDRCYWASLRDVAPSEAHSPRATRVISMLKSQESV